MSEREVPNERVRKRQRDRRCAHLFLSISIGCCVAFHPTFAFERNPSTLAKPLLCSLAGS